MQNYPILHATRSLDNIYCPAQLLHTYCIEDATKPSLSRYAMPKVTEKSRPESGLQTSLEEDKPASPTSLKAPQCLAATLSVVHSLSVRLEHPAPPLCRFHRSS